MYVHHVLSYCLMLLTEGIGFLETGVTLTHGCELGDKASPLKGQNVPITTEPPIKPPKQSSLSL